MSSSMVSEVVLSASLLGNVLVEKEELEAASRRTIEKKIEHEFQKLAHKLVMRLEESYRSSPPRTALEAVSRAEDAIEAVFQGEEARTIKQLLEYIDVESYVREQARLFAAYVDELYEEVYKHYMGRQELSEIEPILMTLTAIKILYLTIIDNVRGDLFIQSSRKAVALLAALTVLVKQRRLDIVKELPQVAEKILAEHFATLQRLEEASLML